MSLVEWRQGEPERFIEALVVAWRNTDRQDRQAIRKSLGPLVRGLDFFQLNDLANGMITRAQTLEQKGEVVASDELVRLAGLVRPSVPQCSGDA